MLTTEEFELERLSERDYRLHWQPRADLRIVAIDAGGTPDVLIASALVDNNAGRADIAELAPAARHFFRVRFDNGAQIMLAERRLVLEGTPNFRDFGGYTTRDNRRVRWGKLYRSGQLNELTDRDLDITADLDIGLVCDFRELQESARSPNRYAAHHRPRIENLPIMPGSTSNIFARHSDNATTDTEEMARVMIAVNRDLALQQVEAYRKLFALLAEHDDGLLIHCAAGKDRTGFGAALILSALGVPEESIMRDYMLSQKYFPIEQQMDVVRKKYGLGLSADMMRPMLEVREEYLRGALDAAHEEYGSLDSYLREALHVDEGMRRELCSKLLES
ncbi:MAG TPA: tyrosine-protein phosphatase [Spongiibacteraceae bacterium]|nr:tyrosine-protein phosphatase [Spongiibacteraceae bacterium]